jgi:hypothetical protein
MSYAVDVNTVSTVGLESSPVAGALAGLRAKEAGYESGLSINVMYTIDDAGRSGPAVAAKQA